MSQAPRHKLFAILTTKMCDPDFGHVTPHVFGAIYDLDANGKATDFTPIDFDGTRIRHWEHRHYGKSSYTATHHAGATTGLFFPITDHQAELLKEGMATLGEEITRERNPFYRGLDPVKLALTPKHSFEKPGRAPVDFVGRALNLQPQGDVSKAAYSGRARAPTTCIEFLFDLLQHVGGVPLDAVNGVRNANALEDTIGMLAPHGGKLHEMKDGRMFYAADFRRESMHGTGSILTALNAMTIAGPGGVHMPLAPQLISGKPFYDPALNENNLGRGSQPARGR